MVNYVVNLSLRLLIFYIWLNSSSCGLQYLAEIKLCEFAPFIYLFIHSVFKIKTFIPYFGHNQCSRRSDSVLASIWTTPETG